MKRGEARRAQKFPRERYLIIALSSAWSATPRIDIERIERDLPRALRVIWSWVESADGDDFDLLLRAVDVEITASTQEVEVRGAVPLIAEAPQSFATIARTSACVFGSDEIVAVPFRVAMSISR